MKRILEADTRMIELTQEAYLWLWDRTGVYVGTLIFMASVVDHSVHLPMRWFHLLSLGFMGLFSGARYAAQQRDLRLLNAAALEFRAPWLRSVTLGILFGSVIADLTGGKLWLLLGDLSFAIWTYLACVCVRDREPKDLFQPRKLAGAGA